MSRKLIQETNLQDIAAAIRTKNGGSSTYKPREMAAAIRALPSGGNLVSKTITQNGSYNPASENADGYSSVTVNVGRNLMQKSITRNGSFNAASDNVDGYSSVSVNVPNSYSPLDEGKVVSGRALIPQTSLSITQNGTFNTTSNNQVMVNISDDTTLVPKTITKNGTYLPANDNADGFDCVNVAVPGGFDANDEGRVVQNGALMPQTSLVISENGIYNTTSNNVTNVNIPQANENLLCNWDFGNIVNTRGNSSYSSNQTIWAPDGWLVFQGVVRLVSGGIKLSRYGSNTYAIFQQRPNEEFVKALLGKTLTISALVGNEFGSQTMQISSSEGNQGVPLQVGGLYFYLFRDSSTVITVNIFTDNSTPDEKIIRAVKLEVGSVQTLATQANGSWRLNEPGNQNEEYIKVRAMVKNSGPVSNSE